MIKRTLSLALMLLGAQTAMAAAEINLGELVTATHDEEWQPVELEEDGAASMKPLLHAEVRSELRTPLEEGAQGRSRTL